MDTSPKENNDMAWMDEIKRPVPILIVDDSPMDRKSFELSTQSFHRELLQASSGEQALKILSERKDIKLVILDERLPGMSGIETFQSIKRLEHPRPWVVFLTGYAGDFVERVSKIGCAVTVSKPMEKPGEFMRDLLTQLRVPLSPDSTPCI
jgi:CheY-like chemotaxis protein